MNRSIGTIPDEVLNADNLTEFLKDKYLYAWSDSAGVQPLIWCIGKRKTDNDTWGEIQNDFESGGGVAAPRDCVFGFELVANFPLWPRGRRVEGVRSMCQKAFGFDGVPSLGKLRRMERSNFCANGIMIILVRLPRPVGARNIVPFHRRKDVEKLMSEERTAKTNEFLAQIHKKIGLERHPTDAGAWQITRHGSILACPPPTYICSRCTAQGHHFSAAHDDVVEHYHKQPFEKTSWKHHLPPWIELEELPREKLAVPEAFHMEGGEEEVEKLRPEDDTKEMGFKVVVRDTSARVPLRLARHLKLKGLNVVGAVPTCGVASED